MTRERDIFIRESKNKTMFNTIYKDNINNNYFKYNSTITETFYENKIKVLQNEICQLKNAMQSKINEMNAHIVELFKQVNTLNHREQEQEQELMCCVCMAEKKTHANMNCCHMCVCVKNVVVYYKTDVLYVERLGCLKKLFYNSTIIEYPTLLPHGAALTPKLCELIALYN